jgi:hypothetical protein
MSSALVIILLLIALSLTQLLPRSPDSASNEPIDLFDLE